MHFNKMEMIQKSYLPSHDEKMAVKDMNHAVEVVALKM